MMTLSRTFTAALLSGLMILCLVPVAWMRNNSYGDPSTLWADTVAKSPLKGRPRLNYGHTLTTRGLYREAMEQFKILFTLRDDGTVSSGSAHREISDLYIRTGLYNEAIAAGKQGLLFAPSDARLLGDVSLALLYSHRYDEALAYAEASFRSEPLPQAMNALGEIYFAKRDYEKAVQYFLMAIEREPDVPFRYWNAALAFEKAGRYESAYQHMSRFAALAADKNSRDRASMFMEQMKKHIREQKTSER